MPTRLHCGDSGCSTVACFVPATFRWLIMGVSFRALLVPYIVHMAAMATLTLPARHTES